MKSINTITVSGNVGNDIELVGRESGKFNIAINMRKKVNGEWTDTTFWLKVFLPKVGRLNEYIRKGTRVVVTGSLDCNEYEGKYYYSIISRDIEFNNRERQPASDDIGSPKKVGLPSEFNEEDLPF